MLGPPYLALQYYVGDHADEAMALLARDAHPAGSQPKVVVPGIVGLSKVPEELELIGRVVVLRTEGDALLRRSTR